MGLTDVLNCITGIIGLIVSILAIIISIHTTKKQTKMDLFNKRYEFYVACDTICGCCICGHPEMIEKRLELLVPQFNDYTFGSAEFLFDKKTAKLILSIYSKGMNYRDICYAVASFESGDIQNNDYYQEYKVTKEQQVFFFENARKELNYNFKKYLQMTKK